MKGYRVYNSIKQLKDMGFKRAAVAAQLQINRRTVDRYWTMTADEYEIQQQALKRGSSLDDYRDQILYWLRAYPMLSAAQVCDWLKEHTTRRTSGNALFPDMSSGCARNTA